MNFEKNYEFIQDYKMKRRRAKIENKVADHKEVD